MTTFGNREKFAIEVAPLTPTWERRYPVEIDCWASLSIWIRGRNLCEHTLPGEGQLRAGVNVPLAPIAGWFFDSWIPLLFEERPRLLPAQETPHETLQRWGYSRHPSGVSEDGWFEMRDDWWKRHFLSAGADGSHLPSVAFQREGDIFRCSWTPGRYASPAPRFIAETGNVSLSSNDVTQPISDFITFVQGSLQRANLAAEIPWVSLGAPSAQLEGNFMRGITLFTGRREKDLFHLFSVPNRARLLACLQLAEQSNPASSPATQALRDLPPEMPGGVISEFRKLLNGLDAKPAGKTGALEDLRAVARDASSNGNSPEECGQLAAQAVRAHLRLHSKPLPHPGEIARDCGVSTHDSKQVSIVSMIAVTRAGRSPHVAVFRNPQTVRHWGNKFEKMRALGHLLLDTEVGESVGAASSPFSRRYHHKRSGAFAAEFILPSQAMRVATGGELDRASHPAVFRRLLKTYSVGARTAAWQLWNRGYLSTPQLRDDLISEHAAA